MYCVSVMTATLFVMRPYIFLVCEADVSVVLRGVLLKDAVSKDVVFYWGQLAQSCTAYASSSFIVIRSRGRSNSSYIIANRVMAMIMIRYDRPKTIVVVSIK